MEARRGRRAPGTSRPGGEGCSLGVGGGFPEGSGVIEVWGQGGGGRLGVRLPDLHRSLRLAAEKCPEGHFGPRRRREAGMVFIVWGCLAAWRGGGD